MKTYLACAFIITFVSVGLAQELYFPPNFSQEWESVNPDDLNWCSDKIEELNTFLEATETNAFIILKDGKMAHEAYFNDFTSTSTWYWASAGKTVTAAMTGILQEEGFLSIDDKTSDYLGEGWTSCEIQDENKITLWHQLTMTSGLDYLAGDVYCTDPDCLHCLNEPGEEWFYHNAPYTLLPDVLEVAADQNYTGVTNSKLCNKIGFIGLWSNVDYNRLFFSTARGMARFGLLMLNDGYWDGEDILKDKAYLSDMINTSQDINKSYGYLWWLNGKESYRLPGTTITFNGSLIPNAPDDLYAAIGANGQILMVVPSQNLIVVRMGNNPDESLVPTNYVKDIWDGVEKLTCPVNTTSVQLLDLELRSNLVSNQIEILSEVQLDKVIIYNTVGNPLISGSEKQIDVSALPQGIYFLHATGEHKSVLKRFIKR